MEYAVMVAAARQAEFETLVAKASKRAQKLGFSPLTCEISPPRFTRGADGVRYAVVDAVIRTDDSKVSEWQLEGRLDHIKDQEALVRGDVPPGYRELGPVCQHCESNRRRKETYLVRNVKTKRRLLVGKSCMADFLADDKAGAVMAHFELLAVLKEAVQSMTEAPQGATAWEAQFFEAGVVLAVAVDVLATHPWVPARRPGDDYGSRQAAQRPTVEWVREHLAKLDVSTELSAFAESTQSRVDAVLAWLGSESLGELALSSNYLHNLRAVSRAGIVRGSEMALWVSAIRAYDRECAAKAAQREAAQKVVKPSVPVGRVGERTELTVTVTGQRTILSEWGASQLYRFSDVEGNDLVWFSSSAESLRQGATYRISARVKGHDVYKDRWQTKLTRVTVQDFKLLTVAAEGDIKKLKKLLTSGLDVNVRDARGRTPLMLAVTQPVEVVETLLLAGADVLALDDQGYGAFELAQDGSSDAVRAALVAAGACAQTGASTATYASLDTDPTLRLCA